MCVCFCVDLTWNDPLVSRASPIPRKSEGSGDAGSVFGSRGSEQL